MSLHGLGVIGAQVAASIKGSDDKHEKPHSPRIRSPSCSVQSTPEVIHPQDFDPSVGAKPYSPFYKHGSPTISYEQLTYETKNNLTRSHLRDIENAGPYATLRTESPRRSKLWEKEKPSGSWMKSLSTRRRMALKAVIAVVTVGSMIAIALGITVAVGGTAWRSSSSEVAMGG
ncbi:hypothetical protein PENSTE_c010G03234 [Penicillium steckii]|uniref:Uncharacterized protein n=1 Tax=Penicillium steckii TaxID=303698 RepID=A0A1V6T8F5_9EURO|nr:hypothetical protein PENSTE_c010G03234 [Penicillium steckii]